MEKKIVRELSHEIAERERKKKTGTQIKKATTLSNTARGKITSSINAMRMISPMKSVFSADNKLWFKFRLNFITLTLPTAQMHDDSTIVREALRPFLDWMKYNYKLNSYVWKAEPQSNGNIHFHITTNVYIHYAKVQKSWNYNLNKLGYIDKYFQQTGKDEPHTSEIKSIRSDKKIASYVAGEICGAKKYKNDNYHIWEKGHHFYESEKPTFETDATGKVRELRRSIYCRLWDSSYNLKNVFLYYNHITEWLDAQLMQISKKFVFVIYSRGVKL